MAQEKNQKPFHEQVAENLIEQLKAGTAPWQIPWNAAEPGSFLPTNPITGKRYKGINAIHLMAQGRGDQRWMTYNQAAGAGAQVRKGEKSTQIQYWQWTQERDKLDENGRPILNGEGKRVQETVQLERPFMRRFAVFNAEQIDGLPAIHRPTQEWDAVDRAEHILAASGARISHAAGSGAFYRPATDSITLPEKNQFESADRYYATALHELGHWTGHPSRLDRDLAHPFGSEGYAKEELRAEIASMILGDELGIGHDPGQHAAYVGSWIKALQDDPLEIFRASSDAEKIHDYVLAFEQKQVQEQQADLRQPHEMTLAEFAAQATTEKLENHGRQWNVTLGDRYSSFSDAENPEAAIADVHRGAVNNALYLNTPGAAEIGTKPTFPPAAVLAEYPDLVAQFPEARAQQVQRQDQDQEQTTAHDNPSVAELTSSQYEAMQAADDAFQRELVRVYGEQKAADARYQYTHDDPVVSQASDAFQAAANDWREAVRDARAVVAAREEKMAAETAGRPGEVVREHPMAFLDGENVLRHWETAEPLAANWQGVALSDNTWFHVGREGDERTFNALRATNYQEAKEEARIIEALAVDIGEVLGAQDGDLDKAMRSRALTTVGAVVGHDPARFDEVSRTRLAGAFGIDPLGSDGPHLERDQVAQRFAHKAEQLCQSGAPALKAVQAQSARHFIDVPYREKSEAKALGARWDRQAQSWYIPLGVDHAPFAKWRQEPGAAPTEDRSATLPIHERTYLAVPYSERAEAKAAGALWDKSAKSWYAGPKADPGKLARWVPSDERSEQDPAMPPREEFAAAMRSCGLIAAGEHPIMDGKRHRVPVDDGKKGALDGFYVGHIDGHPAGRIINNKTGADIRWKSKGYVLAPEAKAALQADAAEKLARRSVEQKELQEATARRVVQQATSLVAVEKATPYMQAKGIMPHVGALTDSGGQKTYVPVIDVNGKQWSMQYIQEDGTKRFAKDSRKEGCFHLVGGIAAVSAAPVLVIAEGYATAASLAEVLGHGTVAAFDSGNLPHVAKALHERYPEKHIIIAGDDDRHLEATQGINPGRVKAEEAARAVGGQAVFPIFAPGEQAANPKGCTDFNDLANKSDLGKEGVARQVGSVIARVQREDQKLKDEQNQLRREQRQEKKRQQQRGARL